MAIALGMLNCAQTPYHTFNRGIQLLTNGEPLQAEAALLQAVSKHPDNAEAWNQLGIIAFERAEFNKARDYFERAMQIDELNPAYPRNLALTHASLNQYHAAQSLLKRSLQIDPANPQTLIELAKVKWLTNQPQKARAYLDKALQLNPSHPEAVQLNQRFNAAR